MATEIIEDRATKAHSCIRFLRPRIFLPTPSTRKDFCEKPRSPSVFPLFVSVFSRSVGPMSTLIESLFFEQSMCTRSEILDELLSRSDMDSGRARPKQPYTKKPRRGNSLKVGATPLHFLPGVSFKLPAAELEARLGLDGSIGRRVLMRRPASGQPLLPRTKWSGIFPFSLVSIFIKPLKKHALLARSLPFG